MIKETDLLKHGYRNLSHIPLPSRVVVHNFFFIAMISLFILFNEYSLKTVKLIDGHEFLTGYY